MKSKIIHQQKMHIARFLIVLSLIYLGCNRKYSALRLGKDLNENDIAIMYVDGQGYFIMFQTMFSIDTDITFCFRERPVIDTSQLNCQLGNSDGDFNCLTNSSDIGYVYWSMRSDFSIIKDQTSINIWQAVLDSTKYKQSVGISQQTDDNITGFFAFVDKDDTFYEVLSSPSASTFQDFPQDVKRNYFSTFYSHSPYNQSNSDNLLVQKQAVCFRQDSIYHLLFLGYVIRNETDIYMVASISYDKNKTPFAMWAGLSFSKDHTNRDMIGIQPLAGSVTDLFSLYASAPFADGGNQIQGFEDSNVVSTSFSDNQNFSWFYFIQFYRNMSTGDVNGDEVITFKISNKYCFVSNVDYSYSSVSSYPSKQFLNKRFMHKYLNCFTPDLTLNDQQLNIRLIIASFCMIALILL